MKIVFAGDNNYISYSHLKLLIKLNYNIIAILSKKNNLKTRIKNKHNLEYIAKQKNIFYINKLDQKIIIKFLKKIKPDLLLVVCYGLILNKEILNLPILGCYNIHFSLLPRWRGAAPIQRVILANDLYTGITIIKMNEYIDDGKIIYYKKYLIKSFETSKSLLINLLCLSLKGIILVINKLINKNKIKFFSQNKKFIIYAKKIDKKESLINWTYPAIYLQRCIRAFYLWPGCYFIYKNKRIKIFKTKIEKSNINNIPGTILNINFKGITIATCKDNIVIEKLQISGKKILSINLFINAYKNLFIIGNIIKN